MYCEKCGKQLDDNTKFCADCGTPTDIGDNESPANNYGNANETPETDSKKISAIKAIVLVLTGIVIGLAVLLLIKHLISPEEPPIPPVASVTPTAAPAVSEAPMPSAPPSEETEDTVAPTEAPMPTEVPAPVAESWSVSEVVQLVYRDGNPPTYLSEILPDGMMLFNLLPGISADGYIAVFPIDDGSVGVYIGSAHSPDEIIPSGAYDVYTKDDIPEPYTGAIALENVPNWRNSPYGAMYDGNYSSIIFPPPSDDGAVSFKFWPDDNMDNIDFETTHPLKMLNADTAFFDVEEIGIGIIHLDKVGENEGYGEIFFNIMYGGDVNLSEAQLWVSGD